MQHHWIFKDISAEQRDEFGPEVLRRKKRKGEVLFQQGAAADELFLIKGGRVKLIKRFENGTEVTLDIRKAGDFIGENMFSNSRKYPLTAVCLQDTVTCGFSRKHFEDVIVKHPKVGLHLIKNLSNRIEWLTDQVASLTASNVEDRLYGVLCNIAMEHGIVTPRGRAIDFSLTHEELGFLTGTHRVSITRAIKTLLKAERILRIDGTLVVPVPMSDS